jgi:hypothetical protein
VNISDVRALCTYETLAVTQHMTLRLRERRIRIDDVINAINTGEIIESYPDDYPHPSCLVFGFALGGRFLHVVCGVGSGRLWIITAYYPGADKWEADGKTRKERLQ